ncbi:MAG: hydroxymethylglutaryl-CoA reductase (NADPH) [Candidatus Methanomethylophilaceae archaeon]|nr:hydroxymethylglutaryl-CoA reductase (NADPH) [Candidatus Methanomethylophilaceae archaeon]MDD3128033.1 hydroxymethylglutaryl-CoA reductase (NADPH) [Candidatus Methanomethylophilaceae archaeon]MDD4119505.1 hydroxymethylglutaryl-CoA reductase (NADPH) [Candidatus Methanomethylophilaceae archaeon]
MVDRKGLKNRGRSRADVDDRRKAVSDLTEMKLDAIGDYSFDPETASKNIENMIGVTQVPLGFAGPIFIRGDYAGGPFLVPMATTEGALVASVSRGMSVISESGGARTKVLSDAMTRAPVFRTEGIDHSVKVINWICENPEAIDDAVSATTKHGRLLTIEPFPNGRNLFLRFSYDTGDAMGMNMATIATEAVCRLIENETGAVMISVSGNMCTDKKPAAINAMNGRGKTVLAEAIIPGALVESKLHTTAASVTETNIRKNLIGSAMAGSMGFNAHAANMAAAVYIATGQDPAHVVEASLCMTTCEDVEGDLYIAIRMPAVEVGTVGGGTRLPSQSEALEIMGCKGDGKARKFAEIVAATVLAGELSTLAAQAAGQLGSAHKELGR